MSENKPQGHCILKTINGETIVAVWGDQTKFDKDYFLSLQNPMMLFFDHSMGLVSSVKFIPYSRFGKNTKNVIIRESYFVSVDEPTDQMKQWYDQAVQFFETEVIAKEKETKPDGIIDIDLSNLHAGGKIN